MEEFDNLYTDIIMEHSMNSPNKRHMLKPSCSSLGHNPNCGDEITLEVELDGDKIKDIAFTGHGCAISQSSTSIMADTLRGKTIEEAQSTINDFISMIKREQITEEKKDNLGDAICFENISNMPARVKCAELAWYTMKDIIDKNTKK